MSTEKTNGREFCPRCGTERLDGRFCGGCGLDLGVPASPEPESFSARYGGISFATPESSRGSTTGGGTRAGVSPLAIGGFLLLIAVGIGAGVIVVRGQAAAAPLALAATQAIDVADSGSCSDEVGPFVAVLEDLDSRLDVGLTFSAYGTRVGDARVAYDRIDTAALDGDCLVTVAGPAEEAFNHYVTAFNKWNDCVGRLSCTNEKVKPKLQAEWAAASTILDQIKGSFS